MAQRTCIFCGGTPVTAEHIIGDWFRRLAVKLGKVPADARPVELRHRADDDPSQDIDFEAVPLTRTGKVACAPCNNGWMSQLEEHVARLLTPLLKGERIHLGDREQRILATWALKTTFVIHAAALGNTTWVPEEHPPYLREHSVPAQRSAVWVTTCEGRSSAWHAYWGMYAETPSDPDSARPAVYGATFAVGPLVVQTFGSTQPALSPELISFPGVQRIWPDPEPFEWELTHAALADEELEIFAAKIPAAIDRLAAERAGTRAPWPTVAG